VAYLSARSAWCRSKLSRSAGRRPRQLRSPTSYSRNEIMRGDAWSRLTFEIRVWSRPARKCLRPDQALRTVAVASSVTYAGPARRQIRRSSSSARPARGRTPNCSRAIRRILAMSSARSSVTSQSSSGRSSFAPGPPPIMIARCISRRGGRRVRSAPKPWHHAQQRESARIGDPSAILINVPLTPASHLTRSLTSSSQKLIV
jgi:hypothetical protein